MISEVARRYAKALFAIAQEGSQNEKIFAELRAVAGAYSADEKVQEFFASPLVAAADKAKALTAAVAGKVSPAVVQFIQVLSERNRLGLFTEIVAAYEEISDTAHGVTRGSVRSAKPLTAAVQQNLETAIYKATHKKVILRFEEDAALMGGLVASVGGWTFDDSLQMHLHRMTEQLRKN